MENAKKIYKLINRTRELDNIYLHSLINKLKPESLLEVGCGNGEMLNLYQNIFSQGIDINPGMISLGLEKNRNVCLEDITNKQSYFQINNQGKHDVICANYVFMELKKKELKKAFENISNLLKKEGKFYFTLTNPRNRHLVKGLGYKIEYFEDYKYEREDLEFIVFLEDQNHKFHDIGIRDFHNPVEVYLNLLKQDYKNIQIQEIRKDKKLFHSLLFKCVKK